MEGVAALAGKTLALALLAGLGGLCIGIHVVLLPAFLPTRDFWLWPACYWGGGSLAVASGIAMDLALLLMLARLARRRLAAIEKR